MVRISRKFVSLAASLSLLGLLAAPVAYGGAGTGGGKAAADLKLGGLLYDNWPKVVGAKPGGTHPLYPEEGRKKGASSWRCKECHGWDYVGREGRYSKGSHYTGIEGVMESSGMSRDELRAALTDSDDKHDFSEWLSESEIEALVGFLKAGLMDMRPHISADGTVTGDAESGKRLYGANCAACHGDGGKAIDFKRDKEGVQGVGWLANDNPQETLHKIRWGHPGSDMPSAVTDAGLSDAETVDILKYSQGLK
jgi:thiosulfate dehydrogenase